MKNVQFAVHDPGVIPGPMMALVSFLSRFPGEKHLENLKFYPAYLIDIVLQYWEYHHSTIVSRITETETS